MSLGGFRPSLYNQYDSRQMRKEVENHKIRPGVIGWARLMEEMKFIYLKKCV